MILLLLKRDYSLFDNFLPKKVKKNTLKQSDFLILAKKSDFNEENSLIQGTMRQFIDRTEFLFRLQKKADYKAQVLLLNPALTRKLLSQWQVIWCQNEDLSLRTSFMKLSKFLESRERWIL
jgi:hypothetical protein